MIPQRNTEPCISSILSGYESVAKMKKELEYKSRFKVLLQKGTIRITDYNETNP